MRILGVDPSLTATGLAFVHDGQLGHYETVKTRPDEVLMARIDRISARVEELAVSADLVAIEGFSYASRDATGTTERGMLGGLIRWRLWRLDVRYVELPVATWRKLLTGNGATKKEQIPLEVWRRFGVEIKSLDALEAFCVAQAQWLRETGQGVPPVRRKGVA